MSVQTDSNSGKRLSRAKLVLLGSCAALILFIASWAFAGYYLKLKTVPILRYEKQWSIAVYTGATPFDLSSPPGVANPVVEIGMVNDTPASMVGDPFMVKKGDTWHLFFEAVNRRTELGSIAYATSRDGFSWKYGKIVIKEPFHLSYPYVFEWENEFYMVPESGNDFSIRLYKAVDFPEKWVYVTDLARGRDFVDNSLVRHDGKWWLFTQTGDFREGTVNLFYADNLEGPYVEHPLSPVVKKEPHHARGGGRIISYGGKLYRFAQDDFPLYGLKAWAIEIEELTVERYSERVVGNHPVVQAGGEWWNKEGMHTVDAHQVGENRWIACVDGYRWRWLFDYNR